MHRSRHCDTSQGVSCHCIGAIASARARACIVQIAPLLQYASRSQHLSTRRDPQCGDPTFASSDAHRTWPVSVSFRYELQPHKWPELRLSAWKSQRLN